MFRSFVRLTLSALAALLFVAILLAAVPLAAEKVERLPIVDKAIEFHGGDLYRSSASELTICSRSGCFDLAVTIDGDRFEYVIETEAGGAARKVRVTNDSVERWDDGEPVALADDRIQPTRDFANARVYFPFLPYRLNDPSVWKEDLGLETWGERELHKVKVTFTPGSSTDADDEYFYWFDPETGRLEQLAYSFGSGDDAGVRFRRAFNYRRVEGILFFDQTNLGASAPGIRVDFVTPESVESMEEVSTVTLKGIAVEPLAGR